MPNNTLRLFGWIKRCPYLIIVLLLCPTQLLAQEADIYPSVRLDLNAGSFLTPLPFDQPFHILGYTPQNTTHVQVTFEEFFDSDFLFSSQPQTMATFETEVQSLLDSLFLSSPTADTSPRTIARHVNNLLQQHASPTSGISKGGAMSFLPWHWAMGKSSQSAKLLTTGSLFDPSDAGTPAKEKFNTLVEAIHQSESGSQKEIAVNRLANFVIDEVKKVKVASAPNAPSSAIQGSWRKLNAAHSIYNEPLPNSDSRWNRLEQRLQGNTATESGEFRVVMPPLKANRTYLIRVQAEGRAASDSMITTNLNTSFWSDTQSSNYVSLDVGLLYVPELKETSAYIGSNFYLRPVAKNIPLQNKGGFMRRFAFTIGLAVQDVEDERSTRKALFGPMSVVLGAGVRVSKYVRAGGGILIFRERDPETFPLTTRTSLAGSPYVSASFDMDVGKHFKGLSGLFAITNKGGAQ